MMFDPDHPNEGGHGKLTVPVASLDTGIPLRDEHVRSAGWLNAADFPEMEFHIRELTDVTEVQSTPDAQTYDVVAVGDFSLHGVTKQIEVPGRITYLSESEMTSQRLPGHILAARATFTLVMAEFGITGPEGSGLIGSKVGESVDIEISIMGSTGSEAP
jgi:polyisoprenoid-binding protein YceI